MSIHRGMKSVSALAISLVVTLGTGIAPAHAGVVTSPMPAVASQPLNAPALSSSDIRDIKQYTKWILEDIKALDERVGDGIGMSTRLTMLAGNYRDLLASGVPPKAKASNYKARVATLANFAAQASDEYGNGDETSGAARYMVIRKQTGPVLTMINKGLGTKYRLPGFAGETATTPTPSATPAGLSASDIDGIKTYADRVVRDITELDIRVQDGIGMSTRLGMLAGDYSNLLNAAVPTGADPATYKARCQTLADFANKAADDYSYGDGIAGSAKYAVIRQETVPLLAAINAGLGTTYALP